MRYDNGRWQRVGSSTPDGRQSVASAKANPNAAKLEIGAAFGFKYGAFAYDLAGPTFGLGASIASAIDIEDCAWKGSQTGAIAISGGGAIKVPIAQLDWTIFEVSAEHKVGEHSFGSSSGTISPCVVAGARDDEYQVASGERKVLDVLDNDELGSDTTVASVNDASGAAMAVPAGELACAPGTDGCQIDLSNRAIAYKAVDAQGEPLAVGTVVTFEYCIAQNDCAIVTIQIVMASADPCAALSDSCGTCTTTQGCGYCLNPDGKDGDCMSYADAKRPAKCPSGRVWATEQVACTPCAEATSASSCLLQAAGVCGFCRTPRKAGSAQCVPAEEGRPPAGYCEDGQFCFAPNDCPDLIE